MYFLAHACCCEPESNDEEQQSLLTPTQQRENMLHINFEEECEKPERPFSVPAGLCYQDGRSAFKQPLS